MLLDRSLLMNLYLYVMTVLIWGTTWLAITFQLGVVSIANSIFYRFALASLILFGWCLFKRLKLKFSLKNHFFFFTQGLFMFSVNYIAAYTAGLYIESGLNAIGFSMVLLFNIVNSYVFYREPLTKPVVWGASMGLAGMAMTFWPALATFDLTNDSLYGVLLSLFGGILASFGNMISGRNSKNKIPVTESNAYAMGYGALIMCGVAMMSDATFEFSFETPYILSLFYLSVFGSIMAFGCYLTLLGRIGPSKAAYGLVMVPIVALIFSTFFEDFVWESHIFVGIGLILLGNVIILWKKGKKGQLTEYIQKFAKEST